MTSTTSIQVESALYIDGRWVAGGGEDLEVENPANGEVTGVVTQASSADVDDAVQAAKRSFPAWSATPVRERAEILRRIWDVLTERADLFAEIINREQGSPPKVARALHVDTPLAVMAATIEALESFEFTRELGIP